jgi:signal transduction histidine kinase/CheY-like chemotaxis protein
MPAHSDPWGHSPLSDPKTGFPTRWAWIVLTPGILALLLGFLSQHSFLWFHSLAELFAVVVGISLYFIAYLSQRFTHSAFLLFLAQGFFWAACLDALHAITYPGMGLHDYSGHLHQDFWIGARLLQATALLLGPFFLGARRLPNPLFFAWGSAGLVFVALAFINATSSTDSLEASPLWEVLFRSVTPYLVLFLLLLSGVHFFTRRAEFDPLLHRFIQIIIALTFLSESAFLLPFFDPLGMEVAGHLLKFLAFWFLLSSIGLWMLARPFELLSQSAFSFDAIPLPVLLVDAKGIVQSCNRVALSMRPKGGIGLHLHTSWHPSDLPLTRCPVCMGIHEGWEVHTELHDEKNQRWVSVHVKEVESEGEIKGFVYVQEDITSRRLAEERLAQTEKMEMIGQMTGGLAHDFNNLLGIVLGALDLLQTATGNEPKALRHVELARQAAQRASQITRSLLAVSRRQALEPRLIDISEALDQMRPLITQTAGPNVALRIENTPGLWANTDPSGLSNAVLNLVINARDAMPQGGLLAISLNAYCLDADAGTAPGTEGSGLLPGHYVRIRVSDQGQGMSPEVLSRLFEPFFTTKERGRGTGLGLAMVHGFVHQSGGSIHVDSQLGKGACFSLFLPSAPPPSQAIETPLGPTADEDIGPQHIPNVVSAPVPRGQRQSLLIVDDEQGLLEVAGSWLRDLGYIVRTTDQPEQARRFLARECFDLLVTDLLMPGGLGGIELAGQARFLCPEIRVLFVSGFTDDEHTQDTPLLQKPYTRETLAWAVHRALIRSGNPAVPEPKSCTGLGQC